MISWKEDYLKRVREADAELLPISVDHQWTHRAFAASLAGLPFPLLADWMKEVTRAYGVLNEERGTAQRSVFVIDREGVLRYKNTAFDARKPLDYEDVLRAVAALP